MKKIAVIVAYAIAIATVIAINIEPAEQTVDMQPNSPIKYRDGEFHYFDGQHEWHTEYYEDLWNVYFTDEIITNFKAR